MRLRVEIEGLDFGDVIRAIKSGQELRRKGWRKEWRIALHNGYIATFAGGPIGWCPWKPTDEDMLAEDWELVQ